MANILIFHAPDTQSVAHRLHSELKKRGLDSMTLHQFRDGLSLQPIGRSLYDHALASHQEIICIASAGLFANCQMTSALRSVLDHPTLKVFSAEQSGSGVIYPTWFLKAFPSHDRELEEIIPQIT